MRVNCGIKILKSLEHILVHVIFSLFSFIKIAAKIRRGFVCIFIFCFKCFLLIVKNFAYLCISNLLISHIDINFSFPSEFNKVIFPIKTNKQKQKLGNKWKERHFFNFNNIIYLFLFQYHMPVFAIFSLQGYIFSCWK